MTTVQSMIPSISGPLSGLNWSGLISFAITLGVGVCIFGGILRLLFGKGSPVVKAVFGCIHVALIYLIATAVYALAPGIRSSIPPLPFITIGADALFVWDLTILTLDSFTSGLLRLFILAFLVNLLEDLVPKGEKCLLWYFYRLLTACAALGFYIGICILTDRFLPQFFGQWAAPIVISIWLLIGILGLSKGLLTLIAVAFNPVLGLLFAFFFSNLVGKQFVKAILTCLLALAVFYGLYQSGFTGFVFSQFSMAAYGPSCLVVLAVLFLFGKFL